MWVGVASGWWVWVLFESQETDSSSRMPEVRAVLDVCTKQTISGSKAKKIGHFGIVSESQSAFGSGYVQERG